MIRVAEPCLGQEELNNVIEAVKSGWISSSGEFIPRFEQEFAHYCGVKYGVATSNGTTALHLALKALGMGDGDEVIVPALTFIATANAVTYCNAKPVFVDSHSDYWCIDPRKIEEKITNKTRAIIPVHLYGHPCDVEPIIALARRYNLFLIEDAAEAHGAEYKGEKTGSFSDIACFSFYGNKILTTGEGGMCLTNDENLAKKMRILRDHGMNPNRRYWHDVIGFNYRMTNMQAAVGLAQMNRLDEFIEKKRQIANWYGYLLRTLADKNRIKLHPEMSWAKCVYWMYSILVAVGTDSVVRDKLQEELWLKGIDTRPFFYSINTMPPYAYGNRGSFAIAEKLQAVGMSLPSSVNLSRDQVEFIADSIIASKVWK